MILYSVGGHDFASGLLIMCGKYMSAAFCLLTFSFCCQFCSNFLLTLSSLYINQFFCLPFEVSVD